MKTGRVFFPKRSEAETPSQTLSFWKSCRARKKEESLRSSSKKELAINKDRAIYVHFLPAASWKHITWRRDPWTSSCHSTPSMRQRSQIYRGGDAVPGLAIASRLTIIGLAASENCCRLLKFLWAEGDDLLKPVGRGGLEGRAEVLWGIQKRGRHGNWRGGLSRVHEAEKCLPWETAVRAINLQGWRNLTQDNRSYLLYPCAKKIQKWLASLLKRFRVFHKINKDCILNNHRSLLLLCMKGLETQQNLGYLIFAAK